MCANMGNLGMRVIQRVPAFSIKDAMSHFKCSRARNSAQERHIGGEPTLQARILREKPGIMRCSRPGAYEQTSYAEPEEQSLPKHWAVVRLRHRSNFHTGEIWLRRDTSGVSREWRTSCASLHFLVQKRVVSWSDVRMTATNSNQGRKLRLVDVSALNGNIPPAA